MAWLGVLVVLVLAADLMVEEGARLSWEPGTPRAIRTGHSLRIGLLTSIRTGWVWQLPAGSLGAVEVDPAPLRAAQLFG